MKIISHNVNNVINNELTVKFYPKSAFEYAVGEISPIMQRSYNKSNPKFNLKYTFSDG